MSESNVGRPIVVGVDGSETAQQAAEWAGDEAARRNAAVKLVSAVHLPPAGYRGTPPLPLGYVDELKSEAGRAVTRARSAIEAAHPGMTVDSVVPVAAPVPLLVEETRDAQLMVLGSRGLGGFTGILVGSTAVALVAHGHCPVAVIRDSGPASGPVVVGVDGSPTSEDAVALAFEEASLRGTDLVAVHTWIEYSSDVAYATARQFIVDWDGIEQREAVLLAEGLAGWQAKYPDVPVRRIVARDRPVRCLLEESAGAQLLVVGSRGHGGFGGMLLGSTSQALVYHATCPLLVVRHD
ncbi:MAG TPA: universal stress protein [Pseudonocardiaceae bacterium]|jgi:nucleotide-binding universal stress UspA family protein|nr:universal stress protein [Pseudonocardiaceae bacterium]